MIQDEINWGKSDCESGFRLDTFEVLNWGTFDSEVWSINLDGQNSFLTGQNGAGKSTLVDALITLLVPQNQITYNHAGGSEKRERTLYSYVAGDFKNVQDADTGVVRPESLRDSSKYTVLLGKFTNYGTGKTITLAQVYRLTPGKREVEKIFVIAPIQLSIGKDFSNFGTTLKSLKEQLRSKQYIQLYPTFREYSNNFRNLLGVKSEQAIKLFYQIVSMKSVDNLTEFVRTYMLENHRPETRIESLCKSFDNLNKVYKSVVDSKARIDQLTPIEENYRGYKSENKSLNVLELCRDNMKIYFKGHKHELMVGRLGELKSSIATLGDQIDEKVDSLVLLHKKKDDISASITREGGDRLDQIIESIKDFTTKRNNANKKSQEYSILAGNLNLNMPSSAEDFACNRVKAEQRQEEAEEKKINLENDRVEQTIKLGRLEEELQSTKMEYGRVRNRASNIFGTSLEIRANISKAINIPEAELPFVGELLQVKDEESMWQGAIERLLHSFSLSLLVPSLHYKAVAEFVDKTNLRGRLVFFRVGKTRGKNSKVVEGQDLVPHKINVKPDHPLSEWLEHELFLRFNFVCCSDLERFKTLPKALTPNGLIKSSAKRYEKNDLHSISDEKRYVMGWSNKRKVALLLKQIDDLTSKFNGLKGELKKLKGQGDQLTLDRDNCRDILAIKKYSLINWKAYVSEITRLEEEQSEIEKSSNLLGSLRVQLEKVQKRIQGEDDLKTGFTEKRAKKIQDQERFGRIIVVLEPGASFLGDELNEKVVSLLNEYVHGEQSVVEFDFDSIEQREDEAQEILVKEIKSSQQKVMSLCQKTQELMSKFTREWEGESQDLGGDIKFGPEFQAMLKEHVEEGLPRHEEKFKTLLNKETIDSLALFRSQLRHEEQLIVENLEVINRSLAEIEYNQGTFITLNNDSAKDQEIVDFKQKLIKCLENSFSGIDDNDLYNEEKFHNVKKLLDRFNGRPESYDLDKRWSQKVTDVRNWFTFTATEKRLETEEEVDRLGGSSGKSGGQKEKLAYTVLAASIAYQFGLEWDTVKPRSFRFVMIDEAFGRADPKATRYGLDLFKKLNLQLLFITPFQKVNVLENYVESVHFVANIDQRKSLIRGMSISEHKENYKRYPKVVG